MAALVAVVFVAAPYQAAQAQRVSIEQHDQDVKDELETVKQKLDEILSQLGCNSETEVRLGGNCYFLDGTNGDCGPGGQLAPQSVLASIATQFVGKDYKTTVSNNCCIKHSQQAAEGQDWGMISGTCNGPGPFAAAPELGGSGCTNQNHNSSNQLSLCVRIP